MIPYALAQAPGQGPSDLETRTIHTLEVKSDGPIERISQEDIDKLIDLRVGRRYAKSEAKHTIQRLYSTGLFHDVLIDTSPVGADQLDVDVFLVPRYVVREITFEDDPKLDAREIRRDLAFRSGEPYSPEFLEQILARLQEIYQAHGYYKPRIETQFDASPERGELKIEFDIRAGKRATVERLDLDVQGNLNHAHIRSLLRTRAGQPYSQLQMDQDIAAVEQDFAYKGYLNPDIYLRGGAVYDSAKDTIALTLRIVPREHTRIVIEGIDPKTEAVRDLPIFTQRGSALAFLQESVEEIERRLQRDGYLLAKADYEVGGAEEERQVTIRVDRGRKHRVATPEFEGNSSIPDERLRREVAVRPASLFRRGAFTADLLAEDASRVQSFYQSRGYLDAKVRGETRSESPNSKTLTPVFIIEEGNQYIVDSVELVGASQVDTETLLREVSTREGEPFSPILIAQDRVNILAAYESRGFREADLRYDVSHPRPDRVSVKYLIEEGPKHYTENIILTGLIDTKPSTVRREVTLEPGAPLSLDAILSTETNLHDLTIFNRVDVHEQPSFHDPNLKNVMIQLEEAKKYNLLYGIGYSSSEGARGTFGISDSNFLGMARTLSLGLRAGRQRQRGSISYTVGRLFDWKLPTVFSAVVDNERALTQQAGTRRALRGRPFDALRLIGSSQSERRLSARESFFIRLNFQKLRIKVPADLAIPLQFFREEERLRLSYISLAYLNDSRDDAANPRTGFFLSGEALLSTRFLASDRQFFRILTQGQYYRQLVPNVVLASSLRVGTIFPFANRLDASIDNPVPISERFFSGGATTLRGLPQDLAGPLLRDPDSGEVVLVDEFGRLDPEGRPVPLGGNALIIANAELRFPLFWFLSGALFYDTGNVFRSLTDLSNAGFSNAVGVGLRANTPVGPIRFDAGYNLNPPTSPGFKEWNFHFTIGHPF